MKFSIIFFLFSGVLARKNRQRMALFQNFHMAHGNNNKRNAERNTLTEAETKFQHRLQAEKNRQKYFTKFTQNRSVSKLHERAFNTYYTHYFERDGQFGYISN
jgi:hypothetical protein